MGFITDYKAYVYSEIKKLERAKDVEATIRLGTKVDVDALERLYDELNEYLEQHTNGPGWRKGGYPVRETAVEGIKEEALYVVVSEQGEIVGSVILNHMQEPVYQTVEWSQILEAHEVVVVHTLVVHPAYKGCGIGKKLLDFATCFGQQRGAKAIRLDVYEKNMPAIALYEKCGFKYRGQVDLGLRVYGLEWFKLYEREL